MDPRERLAEAEAEVERLKRAIAGAPCSEVGCDMVHVGGRNAGCGDACGCSVPVHICTRCGDSDYGENDEARDKMLRCLELGIAD